MQYYVKAIDQEYDSVFNVIMTANGKTIMSEQELKVTQITSTAFDELQDKIKRMSNEMTESIRKENVGNLRRNRKGLVRRRSSRLRRQEGQEVEKGGAQFRTTDMQPFLNVIMTLPTSDPGAPYLHHVDDEYNDDISTPDPSLPRQYSQHSGVVAPMVAYAKSQGLYVGVSVEGSRVFSRDNINATKAYKFTIPQPLRIPQPVTAFDLIF
jgi:hypothetical protein